MSNPTARYLHDMPTIVAYVEGDLHRATHQGDDRSGKPSSKPPMSLDIVDTIDTAWTVVTTWARDFAEMWDYTPPKPYWTDVCAYLERHTPRAIEEHPAADEYAEEIRTNYRHLQLRMGNEMRPWLPLPGEWRCPITLEDGTDCREILKEHQVERYVRCFRCGTVWDREEYERLGMLLGCELTVTIDQAAVLAKVHKRTITRWIDAGELPTMTDMRGRRLIDKRDLTLVAVRREAI